MSEDLFTCPRCHTPNFSARGLRSHHCRANGERSRLTMAEIASAVPSMPKIETLSIVPATPPADLGALATQINATQASAKQHAQLAVVFAIRTGLLCDQAKTAVGHGKFGPWIEKNCPQITDRTAQKYMALARAASKNESGSLLESGTKNEPGSDLPILELMAPDFVEKIESDEAYRAEMTSHVQKVVGEGTISELYKDFGITRVAANVDEETGKRKHYPAKKLSAEEVAKANRIAASEAIKGALRQVETVLLKAKGYRHLTPQEIERHAQHLQDIATKFKTVAVRATAAALAARKGGK